MNSKEKGIQGEEVAQAKRRTRGLEGLGKGFRVAQIQCETELERPREARSLGTQLAMTECELDPELEGNGVRKLNGVNQRGGVIIFTSEKCTETPAWWARGRDEAGVRSPASGCAGSWEDRGDAHPGRVERAI